MFVEAELIKSTLYMNFSSLGLSEQLVRATSDQGYETPSPIQLFFFSSRRRHTRWTGDWSSDVCSSDLGRITPAGRQPDDPEPVRVAPHHVQRLGPDRPGRPEDHHRASWHAADSSGGPVRRLDHRVVYDRLAQIRYVDREPDAGRTGTMSVPTVPLGSQGLRVSRQGLGCMGMSAFYGSDDEKQSIATLERAIELGVTFWDTAEMYGWGANEELLGRVLAGRRDQVVIASKFGVIPDPDHPDDRSRRKTDGSPANVRRSVDAALRRLGTDHIDLYYQHRPDPGTPVEETAGALGEQIQAGKIRHYGLS